MTETRTHEGASLMLSRPKIDGLPPDANLVEITRVYTKPERRKLGDARWLLCEVCVKADETQTFLMLSPKPFDDEPMDADALEGFYRRFGFKTMQREADDGTPHVIMVRQPRERLRSGHFRSLADGRRIWVNPAWLGKLGKGGT